MDTHSDIYNSNIVSTSDSLIHIDLINNVEENLINARSPNIKILNLVIDSEKAEINSLNILHRQNNGRFDENFGQPSEKSFNDKLIEWAIQNQINN